MSTVLSILFLTVHLAVGSRKSGYDSMSYLELGAVALMSMIGLYYSVFAHSLFYLTSIFAVLMLLKPLWIKIRLLQCTNLVVSVGAAWLLWESRP